MNYTSRATLWQKNNFTVEVTFKADLNISKIASQCSLLNKRWDNYKRKTTASSGNITLKKI